MGFQPQDTGTIEQIFGFLKLNLTYRRFFARAYTVKCCLLLMCLDCLFIDIIVKNFCFRIQKSEIMSRAVKQSLNTRQLIPAYIGSKGMNTSIGSP